MRSHFHAGTVLLPVLMELAACAAPASLSPPALELSAVDAYEISQRGDLLILDIRPKRERDRDGAPLGVRSIPYPDNYNQREEFVSAVLVQTNSDRDRPIALICSRGVASRAAQNLLLRASFRAVHTIKGGFLGDEIDPGWNQWGLPVDRTSQ